MAAAMPEGPSGGRARPWRASCGTKQISFGVGAAENYGAACHLGKAALARLALFDRPCQDDRTAQEKRRPASPSEKNLTGRKTKAKDYRASLGPEKKGGKVMNRLKFIEIMEEEKEEASFKISRAIENIRELQRQKKFFVGGNDIGDTFLQQVLYSLEIAEWRLSDFTGWIRESEDDEA